MYYKDRDIYKLIGFRKKSILGSGFVKQLKADAALLFVTVGWGASFILTKGALNELSTFNFLAIRFILAFLISSIIFIKEIIKVDKQTLKYGMIVGIILYCSFAFQTLGLCFTSASKSAFISGFSVVLVPVLLSLIKKNIPDKKVIISVILALIGLGLLTLNNISGVNIGDIYTLISAIVFALYIIFVDKYTHNVKSVSFAIIQIGSVGILSCITSFIMETPKIPYESTTWINIIILSVVCTSGAYIIQNIAQKYTNPSHTALIFTAEPVFAAIFGYIVLGEVLSSKGILGAVLILIGMIVAEVDFKGLMNKISHGV